VGALTIGALVAYLQYVDRFFLPVRDLAEKYNILQSAMASSERIFKVLDESATIQDHSEPEEFGNVHGEIEFKDVWFAYNPSDWVLKGISFKIRAGERVAFVGATGAGKTSLISLISRFYDIQKGEILVDGIDVRNVRQKDLRKHVRAVLQDPFIFTPTYSGVSVTIPVSGVYNCSIFPSKIKKHHNLSIKNTSSNKEIWGKTHMIGNNTSYYWSHDPCKIDQEVYNTS